MKQLTTSMQLNTTLGLIAAHAQLTSFGMLSQNLEMQSHVSDCCGTIVLLDLEQPYCAGCGEWCNTVVYNGSAN